MRDYLNQMTAPSPGRLQAPDGRYARIVGANGPRMLVLAGRATDGAMPAMQPPASTLEARRLLGGDKLLVVLIGASAARGDTHAIADIVREHLHAGADHVVTGLPMGSNFTDGLDQLLTLGPALVDLTA